MNYFTKEELDFIAESLLKNPSHSTLEELNNKYNGKVENNLVQEPINNTSNFEIPSFNSFDKQQIPTMEPPKVELGVFTPPSESVPTPSFTIKEPIEVPTLSTPTTNNQSQEIIMNNSMGLPPLENSQNNTMLNINSNFWEQPNPTNLMTTTDNFNTNATPFFGTNNEQVVNNPIPVGGQYTSGPSMFGQIMKDNS